MRELLLCRCRGNYPADQLDVGTLMTPPTSIILL